MLLLAVDTWPGLCHSPLRLESQVAREKNETSVRKKIHLSQYQHAKNLVSQVKILADV